MASSAFADLLDEWMPWSAVTLSTACPGIGAGASGDQWASVLRPTASSRKS